MKEAVLGESSPGKLNTEFLATIITIPLLVSALTPFAGDFSADDEWGPRMLVTLDILNNTDDAWNPVVAGDIYGNFYVVWKNEGDLDGSGMDSDIYLRKWNASTQTFGPRVLVNNDDTNLTEGSSYPDVVTDVFGNVHCIWLEDDPEGIEVVGYVWRMWNATTDEWGKREQFTYIGYPGEVHHRARIAADSFGNVHVTWHDRGPPSPGTQYRKWNGTTQSWENRMTVSVNSSDADHPDIAVDTSGGVHIVWIDKSNYHGAVESDRDRDIYLRKLDTYTNSWGPIVLVNDDDKDDEIHSGLTRIAVDVEGNLHVVWDESGNQGGLGSGRDHDIFYRRWNASSRIWEPRRLLTDDPANTGNAMGSGITVDPQGNLHIVWHDQSDVDDCGVGKPDIFYREWNSVKNTWENITCLTKDLKGQRHAWGNDIASDRFGNLAVVWQDNSDMLGSGTNDLDIYMRMKEASFEFLEATVDCHPDTLNLRSEGNWVTCYIELPPGYDPRDIDASTILLNDVLPPELNPKYGFVKSEDSYITDHDGDGVLERMVKFNRSEVQQLLSPGDSMPLKITGKLYDDTEFEGDDEIKVIDPINSVQSIDEQIPRQGVGLDQRQPSKRSASPIEFPLRVRESPPLASLI